MELTIIQSKIYEIRNCKVMLDFDLAVMYQVETRVLKQAVRRNIDRFPDDFMFRLSKKEANILINLWVSQNVIPKGYNSGGADIFAFTESGVAMLSSVLRSNTAIKMNINIMRAFVAVRQLILNNPSTEIKELKNEMRDLKRYIEDVFADYNDINEDTRMQMEIINETLAELQNKKKTLPARNQIGFSAPQYGDDESVQ